MPQGWEVVPESKAPAGWEAVPDPQTPAPPPPPSSFEPNPYATYGQLVPPEMAKGMAKGLLSTASGLARLVLPQQARDALSAVRQNLGLPPVSQMTQTTNPAQTFGKGVEQIAEYAIPAAKAAKVSSAFRTGVGVLDALVDASAQGAAATGVASAQHGQLGPGEVATGVATAAVPLVAKPAGTTAQWLGERIERALLKPTKAASEGMTPRQLVDKIYQLGVGGTLGQTYDKTQTAIQQTSQQLDKVLASQPTKVDVVNAFAKTADDIRQGALRTVGHNEELDRALGKISRELSPLVPTNGEVSLTAANELKRGIGDLGAWTRDPRTGQIQVDQEANALSEVADRLYGHLKTSIEEAAPAGAVKALNQKLGDLITIRRAVVHRIPVADRANVLNLGDLLSLSHGTFWVGIANRLLQSGRVANALVEGGQAAQQLGAFAQPAVSEGVGVLTAPTRYAPVGLAPVTAQDADGAR